MGSKSEGQNMSSLARWFSIVAAAALGLVALRYRMPLPALLCALIVFVNARALRARGGAEAEVLLRVHLQAAFDALERGESAIAATHCRAVLSASADPAARRDAVRLLAYAYASTQRWAQLMELLESGGAVALGEGELEKYERAARELGRSEEARRLAGLRDRVA